MTLSVSGADGGAAALPEFYAYRPCYLADLRTATVDQTTGLEFGRRRRLDESQINGNEFAGYDTYIDTLDVGTVVEYLIDGVDEHILHLHINPYQIATISASDTTYFQVGDWHDSLAFEGGEVATVRMQLDTFTGKLVVHCHVLEHEDQGMMALYSVQGTEGTVYAAATTLDSTCYRGTERGYAYADGTGGGGALYVNNSGFIDLYNESESTLGVLSAASAPRRVALAPLVLGSFAALFL